ncbi:LUD domain-containing protein [uncultured Deefgea sp.]|uniref:LutC/YkgG family protein n=1 Tax=uncultured Deefgea sp. TaxID=1304914 RepID=UPI0025958A0E|nr:LUD domain-containing protein [uncultured Deefgea sp.]
MSSRDIILAQVRVNQPPASDLPKVALFDANLPSPWPQFQASLRRMGGQVLDCPDGMHLNALLAQHFPQAKIIASVVPELVGNFRVLQGEDPHRLAEVDVAVVRARFAVAETGSVCFTEQELVINALAYLAQHLVVLLDVDEIVGNLHHAYQRPEFRSARYAVLHSGPSATADIEGTLVHGAQGVRSLSVIAYQRSHDIV